ncbi:unnamed protein product, partial [Musa acuminata subsp. burmannicoides]
MNCIRLLKLTDEFPPGCPHPLPFLALQHCVQSPRHPFLCHRSAFEFDSDLPHEGDGPRVHALVPEEGAAHHGDTGRDGLQHRVPAAVGRERSHRRVAQDVR